MKKLFFLSAVVVLLLFCVFTPNFQTAQAAETAGTDASNYIMIYQTI